MKIMFKLPPQVAANLRMLLGMPNQSLALHIGSLRSSACICIEYGVRLPDEAAEAVAALVYKVGSSDLDRTRMLLVEDPAQFLKWAESMEPGAQLCAESSADIGGLLLGEHLDGAERLDTVLEASPMSGYSIPDSLAHTDASSTAAEVRHDAERYAGLMLKSVPGSMLVVDLEGNPSDRARFAKVVKQAVGIDIGPGFAFEAPDIQPKTPAAPKTKEKETTMTTPASPNLKQLEFSLPGIAAPTVPPVSAEAPAPFAPPAAAAPEAPTPEELDMASAPVEPPAAKRSRASRTKTKDETAVTPGEVSSPVPAPAAAVPAPAAPVAEAPAAVAETPAEAPEDDGADDGTEEVDASPGSQDGDPGTAVPRKVRRRTADLDREAQERLQSRGYTVIQPSGTLFEGLDPSAAADAYRGISTLLQQAQADVRDRFLETLPKPQQDAQETAALKASLQKLLDSLK